MVRVLPVLLVLQLTSHVQAQPAGAQAEVLFRQGRELMAAGKFAEACEAFEHSQKLDAAVTTLMNLAACREKNGQIATAWGLFLEAGRQTRAKSDAAARQLHAVAEGRAKALEARVSKLAINVSDQSRIDGLEIARGSESVASALWNRALPVDGGSYTISARAPGAATWTTQITIAPEADTKTIDIPDLRTLPRDVVPDTAASPRPEAPEPSTSGGGSRVVPIAVGVGALVLLGGAIGVERWGASTYDDAKAETMDQARRDALYQSANTKRYVAQGMAVAGIACAGVAVWLYLRQRGEPTVRTAHSDLVVSPMGIALVGRF